MHTINYKFIKLMISFLLLLLSSALIAQEIDENALFSDSDSIIESNSTLSTEVDKELNEESVTFSGRLTARGIYYKDIDNDDSIINYSEADFFIDVRLQEGIKGFLDFSITSIAQNEDLEVNTNDVIESIAKEFFIDVNINRNIYFRVGKQVLKWSRTYLWNPTDLINIEKRDFFYLDRYRTGVYGTKIHVPFDQSKNFYMFFDLSDAKTLDDIAYAAKYEFLIRNTEIALSVWNKNDSGYALGLDFSTNVFNFDITGEISHTQMDNYEFVEIINDNEVLLIEETNKKGLMYSIGISKSFDWELSDRIILSYEFFYNENGYTENIFNNVEAKTLLFANNLYEPNYYSKYYNAFFLSINKCPITDMILNFNGIFNLSDDSYVLILGTDYNPVNHFTFTCNLNYYGGPFEAEYTYEKHEIGLDIALSVVF